MKLRFITTLIMYVLSSSLCADQSMYCPQNHGYINIGMTVDQVIAACGQPLSQQTANQFATLKVPMQQLIYRNQGAQTSFEGSFQLRTGLNGVNLQVDVVDDIVKSVNVGGSNSNAFSICDGVAIQVGDPVDKVYNACGNPSIVNTTYVNKKIPSLAKPQVWIYQSDPYQPSVSLTFIDGKLQSINQ